MDQHRSPWHVFDLAGVFFWTALGQDDLGDVKDHLSFRARGRVAELLDELRQTVIVLQVAVAGLTGKGWCWRWGCPRRARFRVSACTLAGQQKVEVTVKQRQTAGWLVGKLAQLIEVPTDRLVVLFPNGDHLHNPASSSARKAKLGLQLRSAPRSSG
eukprot:s871_g21.t1